MEEGCTGGRGHEGKEVRGGERGVITPVLVCVDVKVCVCERVSERETACMFSFLANGIHVYIDTHVHIYIYIYICIADL